MKDLDSYKNELLKNGFAVIANIHSNNETESILDVIDAADSTKSAFRRTTDLIAVRQFLKEVPESLP